MLTMASPRATISVFKHLSPQKVQNLSNLRQTLSPKSRVRNTLTVESALERPKSPVKIDTPHKKRIVNEGFFNKGHEVLGNGSFGIVYKASYKGENVAAKVIKRNIKKGNSKDMEKEAAHLKHSNIVRILKVDQGPALTLITMELCGKSLQDIIEDNPIPKECRVYIWKSIAEALQYCHEKNIVHSDVKPKNVLMGMDNQPKLADFGSAIFMHEPYVPSQFHGTPGYAAPEVVCGYMPSPSSDVYSLGILAWQMISRIPPFTELHQHTILYLTGKGITPFDMKLNDGFNGEYKNLYRQSWSKQSENRPNLTTVIQKLNELKLKIPLSLETK